MRHAVALLLLAAVLAGCGGSSSSSSSNPKKQPITIGTEHSTEQHILGQLYKQALEAKGFTVRYEEDLGPTEQIDKALTSGKIDFYPEYTGAILSVVFHDDDPPASEGDAYDRAKKLQEQRGFTLLDRTPFSDPETIAVLASTASKSGVSSIDDLKKLGSLSLGGPPELRTREQGLLGLRRQYGLTNVRFVPLAGSSPYAALDSHKVQAVDVPSTDPQLDGGAYRALDDPKNVFGFQNVAPVVSKTLADRLGSSFTSAVNELSVKLNAQAMTAMNKAVTIGRQPPAKVAHQFLEANLLL